MNLYEATMLADLNRFVDEETGEINVDAFMSAQGNLENKQLATAAFIKNENATLDALEVAIKRLTERKKSAQNRIDRVRNALIESMKASKVSKLVAPDNTYSVALSVAASTSVSITDEKLIPQEFLVPQPPKIDKTGLKKALTNGEFIFGATLEYGDRLLIS